MALTITNGDRGGKAPSAPTFTDEVIVICDDTYIAGGWPLDLTDYLPVGATVLDVRARNDGTKGYLVDYDHVNSKLRVWESASPVAAELVDLSTANAMDGEQVTLIVTSF